MLAAIRATPAPSGKRAEEQEVNPLDRLAGGVFVGREAEMEELRAGLEDALSGHGRLLLLAGEPGIGKTRTAEELVTYARLRRAQVLWGRCYEGQGAPAYWPWVQVIRTYVHEREPKVLLSERDLPTPASATSRGSAGMGHASALSEDEPFKERIVLPNGLKCAPVPDGRSDE